MRARAEAPRETSSIGSRSLRAGRYAAPLRRPDQGPDAPRRGRHLSPSDGRPFTHILKPAGPAVSSPPAGRMDRSGARPRRRPSRAGTALVACPTACRPPCSSSASTSASSPTIADGLPWKISVRFSTLPQAKYNGTIERVAGRSRPLDGAGRGPAAPLRRALFAWLIADGDMHLKNLALLKTAERRRRGIPPSAWRRSTTR